MLSLSRGVAVQLETGRAGGAAALLAGAQAGAARQDAAWQATLSARSLDLLGWAGLGWARREETIMLSQWSKPNATDTATARVACHKAVARA